MNGSLVSSSSNVPMVLVSPVNFVSIIVMLKLLTLFPVTVDIMPLFDKSRYLYISVESEIKE